MICPDCNGDGKETCHNPDHGFTSALDFNGISRLGCPVCGHDAKFKVIGGGICQTCAGSGEVSAEVATFFNSEG